MLDPTPTALDLKFRLFGTPVRVHPSFWIFSLIFGLSFVGNETGLVLLWVGCMFLSILVHEFGHITMGRIFGRSGRVLLYSFGGIAVGDYELPRRGQRIAVSLAGPAAGLLLYGLVVAVQRLVLPQIGVAAFAQNPTMTKLLVEGLAMLWMMNLVWSLLNLVPILPLDGGHVSQEVFSAMSPGNGLRMALQFSMLLAGVGAVYSVMCHFRRELPYPPINPIFTAIILGLMAVENYQMLRQIGRNRWDY